ncbi:unnamed protein product [Urochloa humidicola]
MQIYTQNEDYLIDTIALHGAMGFLQPLFANPSICKGTTELPGSSFRLPEFQSDPFKALAVTASYPSHVVSCLQHHSSCPVIANGWC